MVCLVNLDLREIKGTVEKKDPKVHKDPPFQCQRVIKVIQDPLDSLATEELLDPLEYPVFLVKRETLDCLETEVSQVCLD